LLVADGQEIWPGTTLCQWDPHFRPILAEHGGRVRFADLVEGRTLRTETDPETGARRQQVIPETGPLDPCLRVEGEKGEVLAVHFIPRRATLEIREGQAVVPGTLLARVWLQNGTWQYQSCDLRRVRELFEARPPRRPAPLAESSGFVRVGRRDQSERYVSLLPTDHAGQPLRGAREIEQQIPADMSLRVFSGDRVKIGERLTHGLPDPHEILRLLGNEELERYLVTELQLVYRRHFFEVDDKHIEVILARMVHGRVRVSDSGDTQLTPGRLMDRSEFLKQSHPSGHIRVTEPGDSRFQPGELVLDRDFDWECSELRVEGKRMPTGCRPRPATCERVLRGVTAVARSESPLCAGGLMPTPRALAEAALADTAVEAELPHERVLLGRVIPAGTGFLPPAGRQLPGPVPRA
jgi:DNA-directed RNA polymerase subunit beta'